MSNPQMLMHHLEPLPSRRARHEQKFWLEFLSAGLPCGVQAYTRGQRRGKPAVRLRCFMIKC